MRCKVFEDIIKSAIAIDNFYTNERIDDIVQFEQIWGSTTLGFSGCGGDMMTSAITTVVFTDMGADVFFGGRKAYRVTTPNEAFVNDIDKRCMKSVNDSYVYFIGDKREDD